MEGNELTDLGFTDELNEVEEQPTQEIKETIEETPQVEVTEEPTQQPESVDLIAELKEQGFQLETKEDLVNALTQKAEFERKAEEYQNSLSSYEQDEEFKAIKAFREAGEGSALEYLQLKNTDYKNMSEEQVLWEQYRVDNKDNFKYYGEDFMKMEFQKKLEDYEVKTPDFVDDIEKEEWERSNKIDIERKRLQKAGDINKARTELTARKEKYAVLPDTPTKQTDTQVQETLEYVKSGVSKALQDFQPIKISISDKKEEAFNLAADDAVRQTVDSLSKNPQELLSLVGFNEDGNFDFNKMVEATTLLVHAKNGTLGKHLSEHVLTVKNSELVESTLENPKSTTTQVSSDQSVSDSIAAAKAWGILD